MSKDSTLHRELQRNLLRNGYCPYCNQIPDVVTLVGQQELDGEDHSGNSFYVMYWSCPQCERTEDELASSLGMKCKMCKTCHGFGTIKWYEESDDECDHCDGVGYLLEEA